MRLTDITYTLINAIKATPEYASLKQYKAIIDKNDSLRGKLIEFSKKQTNLYSGKISGKEADLMARELEENYRDISKINEVAEFLKASKQFNDIMFTVYKSINDSIEKDIKFI